MDYSDIFWSIEHAHEGMIAVAQGMRTSVPEENRRPAEEQFLDTWFQNVRSLLIEMKEQHRLLEEAEHYNDLADEQLRVFSVASDDMRHYTDHAKEKALQVCDLALEAHQHAAFARQFIDEMKTLLSEAAAACENPTPPLRDGRR